LFFFRIDHLSAQLPIVSPLRPEVSGTASVTPETDETFWRDTTLPSQDQSSGHQVTVPIQVVHGHRSLCVVSSVRDRYD
jgi:hypothetical protein